MIVDGCDNFATKYLVNDAAFFLKKPDVFGSIFRFEGQASTFTPPEGPCYRCVFPEPPPAGLAPSCDEAGVLGVLPGVVGLIQATEAIKLLLGKGRSLAGRLWTYDALERPSTVQTRKDCAAGRGDSPRSRRSRTLSWSCHFDPVANRDRAPPRNRRVRCR